MLNYIKQKTYHLLRFSEKWTKTDMVYLAKGGFWLTGDKIVNMASAFVLAILYANLLSKEDYATYKYILSIVGMLGLIVLPGMGSALFRSASIGLEGSLYKALKAKLKYGAIAILAAVGVSIYYFYQGNNVLAGGVLAAGIITPLVTSLMLYETLLQGKRLFRITAIVSSTKQIAITAVIAAILLIYPKILFFVVGYFLADLILTVILFRICVKKYPPNKKEDPQLMNFGKHLSVITLLGMIPEYLDKILMWHYLGAAQLAIYSFAIIPTTQIQAFLKSIPIIAFPKIASQDKEVIKKTLPLKMVKFSLLLAVGVAVYILIAPYAFRIFFPEYMDSVKYSQIFALSVLFFPARLISHLLIAHAKKKSLYFMNIVSPIIKIILLFVLLPAYCIWGAIAALLLAPFINLFFLIYFFKKL